MQIETAIIATCLFLVVVFYYRDRKIKSIKKLEREAEFLRTSLSLEGISLGIIIILMAYSSRPEIIILPIFTLLLVLILRVVEIEDIEKELREDCEREAASQTTKSQRGD